MTYEIIIIQSGARGGEGSAVPDRRRASLFIQQSCLLSCPPSVCHIHFCFPICCATRLYSCSDWPEQLYQESEGINCITQPRVENTTTRPPVVPLPSTLSCLLLILPPCLAPLVAQPIHKPPYRVRPPTVGQELQSLYTHAKGSRCVVTS